MADNKNSDIDLGWISSSKVRKAYKNVLNPIKWGSEEAILKNLKNFQDAIDEHEQSEDSQ